MKRLFCVAGLFALTVLRPSVAVADTLDLVSLGKGSAVSLTIGSAPAITGWAGEINWLRTGSDGFTEVVRTYCVDLFDDALPQQIVAVETTTELTPLTSPNSTPGAGGRAAWLVNTYGATIEDSGTDAQAAGLQIAIWQTMYLPDAFSVSASAEILGWASTYLASVGSNSSVAVYFNAGEGEGLVNGVIESYGQDQIQVPEPGSILLLMVAMSAILGYHYRLNRRSVNA